MMIRFLIALGVFFTLSWPGIALAQDEDEEGYTEAYVQTTDSLARDELSYRLKPLGFGLMGDSIDEFTGALSFNATDVSIPGNSILEVAFRRVARDRETTARDTGLANRQQISLGDWEIDVPYITSHFSYNTSGPYPIEANWEWEDNERCDKFPGPREEYEAALFNGINLNIPGRSGGKVLEAQHQYNPGGITSPWDTGPQPVKGITKDHTIISCIAEIGSANGGGEGFIATTTDGTQYRMDRIIRTPLDSESVDGNFSNGSLLFEREEFRLAATEVRDVHGNWVKYDYTTDGKLTKIHSNDNRQIDISYVPGTKNVSSVTANGRTWTYTYQSGLLHRVTQPDSRQWTYNLGAWSNSNPPQCEVSVTSVNPINVTNHACLNSASSTSSISVTHPYGMTATFEIRKIVHGFTSMTEYLGYGATREIYRPERNLAVEKKTLSGPQTPTSIWEYSYEGLGYIQNPGDFNLTRYTRHTDPDGSVTETDYYVFGYRRSKAVAVDRFASNGGALLEEVDYTYTPTNSSHALGSLETFAGSMYYESTEGNVYVTKAVTKRGTDIFTTDSTYDISLISPNYSYGRPLSVSSKSNLSTVVRTENLTYTHNKPKWVIGLVDTVTRNGKLFDDLGYDSFGRVTTHDQFGVRRGTYTYYTSGTSAGRMQTSKDGLNRTITYNNWKRGVAQQVIRPDGEDLLTTVDDNGWVTSQTDAKGNQTGYQYSNVGWMTKIDRPAPWADTDITYTGIGTANFYQTATRDTEEAVIWYDTMHRPYRERVRPLGGGGATTHTKMIYDTSGRTVFNSFPSSSADPTTGTETTYDALNRPLTVRENVAPFATTSYEYLAGNKTRVTDPEDNVTTTTIRAFGRPSRGEVVQIAQPLGKFTDMTYDNYGNLLTARQYGNQNGFNVTSTQRYYYDSRLRLCRHSVPETGDTLYQYDNANQVTGLAKGQAVGTACTAPPASAKIASTYDSLGRLTLMNYPDTTPDISITYDLNGNVTRNLRGTADWRLTYDNANQITEEKLLIDGRTYTTGYEYNTIGALAFQTFPTGRHVEFAPNGLGQATKAAQTGQTSGGVPGNSASNLIVLPINGFLVLPIAASDAVSGMATFASGITYHLNGAVNNINYGNGFVHSTTYNDRQLLSSIDVAKGAVKAAEFGYSHDKNGRFTAITDGAVLGQNKAFTYDGLNRLKTASGAWGAGTFTYDALDNIRKKQLGSRIVDIEYNGVNRLSRARDNSDGNAWKNYGYDARGNVTNNGRFGFTYDLSDQPTAVTGGSANGSFIYDGARKRVKQVVGGKTIYSIYGASGSLIHRDDVTANLKTDYIRAAGKTIARIKGGMVTFPHQDHLGSPVASTDATGAVAWREDFTPYGEKRLDPNENKDDEGFTGHVDDSATGLTYMQARYYDPVIGRFLSNDPMSFSRSEFDPRYFSRYAYVGNNPIYAIDPSGEKIEIAGENEKEILELINGESKTQYAVDNNGNLVATDQVNEKGSSTLSGSIDAGISSEQTISISIQPDWQEGALNAERSGQGVTVGSWGGDQKVMITGKGTTFISNNGTFTPATAGSILAHEIAVHAVPRATKTELIDGIGMDNQIRSEIGHPLRPNDPHVGAMKPEWP